MDISVAMIDQLAHLARLRFDDAGAIAIQQDLQKMVQFVEKLGALNTAGVAPLLHMGDASNQFREDVVTGAISRVEALKNAPAANDTFFRVPTVIKK